jgi:glycosyltransferase involved in cell wall biosynthesis
MLKPNLREDPQKPRLRKLNILQILPKASIESGGSLQAFQLTRGLAESGHRVSFVCRFLPGEIDIIKTGRVELVQIPMKNEFDISSIIELYKLMIRQKTDVVHVHKGLAHTLAYIAAYFAKVPVFVVNRGVSFPLDRFNRIKYKWRRISKIVAVSEQLKQILIDSGKIAPDKIEVIYGGTDLDKFNWQIKADKILKEFNIAQGSVVVGIIANVRKWKGHTLLLQAAQQIIKAYPSTIFLIVGDADNSLGQQLKKTTTEANLQNNVMFTGYRQDIPQLLAAMDFTVNCSYSGEGLTGALRESLAMKKPAISTDVGGNRELIIDHKTGLLIPANQIQALIEALSYLLENPAERVKMGEAGYKFIKEKFTLETRISQMEKLYYDLLAE